MTKDAMIADFYKRYEELKTALKSANIDRIRELSLDVNATIHPAEVSGRDVYALREYMLAVGRNTREILYNLTLEQVRSMVLEERVMRILEAGGQIAFTPSPADANLKEFIPSLRRLLSNARHFSFPPIILFPFWG